MELVQTHWNGINQEEPEYALICKNTIEVMITNILPIHNYFDAYLSRLIQRHTSSTKVISVMI